MNRLTKCLAAGMLTSALGACASMSESMTNAISHVTDAQPAQERVHTAMDLLDRGEEARARALLESVSRQEPGNVTARRLLDEINADPHRALGSRTRSYTVRDDDTMSTLAQRFLGDPLMFYALARANNMAPRDLRAGQTIQVPDRGRTTQTASARAPSPTNPSGAPAPAPVAASTGNANVAQRANQLRLRGLERLNAGDADGAVALLGQAHAIDAGNGAIQADLSRAQRIQASLRTH